MPKITAASFAMTALIALGLTGCSGVGEPVPSESVQRVTPTVEETTAPLVAETPEPYEPEQTYTAAEQEFINTAQAQLNESGYGYFTDEQVLTAGTYACESPDEAQAMAESMGLGVSDAMVDQARAILCP